ncbi:MAG: GFA family protein [Pseudomonadales bacterium]|nr:GFA family protein [Pseudomonadales bacterium]
MKLEGGCYCGAVRYRAEGEPLFKGQCCCRECQYISGGSPNVVIGMPEAGFSFTRGEASMYRRGDLEQPVTRYFCPDCGTHLITQPPGGRGLTIIKVGTLDDPGVFDKPDMVIWTSEKQAFHHIPEGVPSYEGFAPRH